MPKLHPHIGLPTLRRRVFPALATIAILLVAVGINLSGFQTNRSENVPGGASGSATAIRALSEEDAARYRQAFALQEHGKVAAAEEAIADVDDPLLHGVLLGERYLTPGREPNFSELALWLARYGDHAQAAALYKLAQGRTPRNADFLTEPAKAPAAIKAARALSSGVSTLSSYRQWTAGLAAFRKQDMSMAAAHFRMLLRLQGEELSSEDRAALTFWAFRAARGAGDWKAAGRYLSQAAAERPGFYSLLARRLLESHDAGAEEAARTALFLKQAAVRRMIALKQIGQDALAQQELDTLFAGRNREDRRQLLQIAKVLNMGGEQMQKAMAVAYESKASDTHYPLPRWTPTLGFHVEPALLFAIMRQESGFNPNAKSPRGATGVMQLMPATAHAMAADARIEVSAEPSINMSLGQHYLEHLMDISSVGDNLIYLLAAYNAGPGSVAAWKRNIREDEDPLLFVESIPCAQTRDYVERVMGNYWVYSEMLHGEDNASLIKLAQGRWPHYEGAQKLPVRMVSRLSIGGAE